VSDPTGWRLGVLAVVTTLVPVLACKGVCVGGGGRTSHLLLLPRLVCGTCRALPLPVLQRHPVSLAAQC
jgi:hypothetical protein